MDIKERLRRIHHRQRSAPPPLPDLERLGGEQISTDSGTLMIIRTELLPTDSLGPFLVPDACVHIASLVRCLASDEGMSVALDVETTGIRSGSGCCPFLIGLATVQNTDIIIEQLLLCDFPDEPALLTAAAQTTDQASALLTFNGRSFDWPVLTERFPLHRLPVPSSPPHIDLLHIARKLWKGQAGGCSLQHLEQSILRFCRPPDIAGSHIPAVYFDFLRTGRIGGLKLVLEHNRLDLLSLLSLSAVVGSMISAPLASDVSARERTGLGRILESSGDSRLSRACYEAAADDSPLACRHLVRLCKRRGEYEGAAVICKRVIDRFPDQLWAYVELAKHLEHCRRRPDLALAVVDRAPIAADNDRWRQDLQYRRCRLQTKVSGSADNTYSS